VQIFRDSGAMRVRMEKYIMGLQVPTHFFLLTLAEQRWAVILENLPIKATSIHRFFGKRSKKAVKSV
jgi:hypothetical protein